MRVPLPFTHAPPLCLQREAASTAARAAVEEAAAARAAAAAAAARQAESGGAAARLEAAAAELRRTHGREMAAVAARYESLKEAVQEYHIRLAEALDAADDAAAGQENEVGPSACAGGGAAAVAPTPAAAR